jgi:predicted nucleotidyltransferase
VSGATAISEAELRAALREPTDEEVAAALARFVSAVRASYGDRVHGIFLFGSRARGDHRADSDADVAVVLADGDWEEWRERRRLNRLAEIAEAASHVDIQPWPISWTEWMSADSAATTPLSRSARREGRRLETGP